MRVGNAAHGQLQLDVYGEVMDAPRQARWGGLVLGEANWAVQRAIVEHLETIWQESDEVSGKYAESPALHPFPGDGLGRL